MRELYVPLLSPEDIKPHLGSPSHWREGFSAQELAYSWFATKDLPSRVQEGLANDPVFCKAKLLDALFERKTYLNTPKAPSQSDLLAYVDLGEELGLIAVEGKVEEPFDKYVYEWLGDSPTRMARLQYLCKTLQLDAGSCGSLRYQLLHRTASAIYEAKRYHIRQATMLVHSFSASARWFEEFRNFSEFLGIALSGKNVCSQAAMFEGVTLRLAWITDQPRNITV